MSLSYGHKVCLQMAWKEWVLKRISSTRSAASAAADTQPSQPSQPLTTAAPMPSVKCECNPAQEKSEDVHKDADRPSLIHVLDTATGRLTQNYYLKYGVLSPEHRNNFLQAIAQFYAARGRGSLSAAGIRSLCNQIKSHFPTETLDNYLQWVGKNKNQAGGLLASKLYYWLRKYHPKLKTRNASRMPMTSRQIG